MSGNVLARCGPALRRLFKAASNRGSEQVNRHEDGGIVPPHDFGQQWEAMGGPLPASLRSRIEAGR